MHTEEDPRMVVETQKKLYIEGHTPAGKSWCLRVTNQPLGIDQALLCAGPGVGAKDLAVPKTDRFLLRWV